MLEQHGDQGFEDQTRAQMPETSLAGAKMSGREADLAARRRPEFPVLAGREENGAGSKQHGVSRVDVRGVSRSRCWHLATPMWSSEPELLIFSWFYECFRVPG